MSFGTFGALDICDVRYTCWYGYRKWYYWDNSVADKTRELKLNNSPLDDRWTWCWSPESDGDHVFAACLLRGDV